MLYPGTWSQRQVMKKSFADAKLVKQKIIDSPWKTRCYKSNNTQMQRNVSPLNNWSYLSFSLLIIVKSWSSWISVYENLLSFMKEKLLLCSEWNKKNLSQEKSVENNYRM